MALAEAGMRVLLLERGRRFDPGRDFPMNHLDWELRPRAFRDTGTATGDVSLLLEEGARPDPRYGHLRSADLPGCRSRAPAGSASRRPPKGSAARRSTTRGRPIGFPNMPSGPRLARASAWIGPSAMPISLGITTEQNTFSAWPVIRQTPSSLRADPFRPLPIGSPTAASGSPGVRRSSAGHCFPTRWRSRPEASTDAPRASAVEGAFRGASSARNRVSTSRPSDEVNGPVGCGSRRIPEPSRWRWGRTGEWVRSSTVERAGSTGFERG